MAAMKVLATAAALLLSLAAAAEAPPQRHLLYLHGRIVQEQQSPQARHREYGVYELERILAAFRERGFAVAGEIRPRETTADQAADQVVAEVRALLAAGVPADHVTVVGASLGARIALLAAARLGEPEIRFCLLGACLSSASREIADREGRPLRGRLLAIREASDELTGGCPPWPAPAAGSAPGGVSELVLSTGLRHGFLYRPLPEWVEPVAAWAVSGELPETASEPSRPHPGAAGTP